MPRTFNCSLTWSFALCLLIALCGSATHAQSGPVITAASCQQSAVNAVINGPTHVAVNGDTIAIPSGSCTWSGGGQAIVVPNGIGITITGTGTPEGSASEAGASASCSDTNITLSSVTAFKMTPNNGNSTSRLSCMALTYGGGASEAFSILGNCTASGCPNLRIDNLTFNHWSNHASAGISYGISAVGNMFGVMDHNTINGTAGGYLQLVELSHASYQGVGFYGDNAWAQSEAYGSSNFLFIENNLFNSAGCCENEGSAGGLLAEGGTRVVVRNNTFNISDQFNFTLGWHGTESSGRPRGGRAFEYYNNTINYPSTCIPSGNCAPTVAVRSGTGLIWGNTIASATVNLGGFGFNTLRVQGTPGGLPACDGAAPGDGDDPSANASNPAFSGKVSAVAGNTYTISGTPGWTVNQWIPFGAPYSVHDVTKNTGSEIVSNTSNTVTLRNDGGPGTQSMSVGDSIIITRAFYCMDQGAGRGAGFYYPYNLYPMPTFPVASNQAYSPANIWMNSYTNRVISAAQSGVGADTARVIRNRDYYAENTNQPAQTSPSSPFDGTTGTTGIGHGTLANRPNNCTTGVSYWATDQGNWNSSGSGGQGQLFACSTANTWSLSYQPYTYPHPLIAGGTGANAPNPPTNVSVTVQ